MNKLFQKKGNPTDIPEEADHQQQEKGAAQVMDDLTENRSCVSVGNNTDNGCFVDTQEEVQPTTATCVDPAEEIAAASAAIADGYESRLAMSMGATAVSSLVAILILAYHVFFRRQQRRKQAARKHNNSLLQERLNDLVKTVASRDQEVRVLERRLLSLKESTGMAQEQAEQDLHRQLQGKQEQCDRLHVKVEEMRTKRQETDARLAEVLDEVNKYAEQQQDQECQLLEQKLQASHLEQIISERDSKIEQMQQVQTAQAARIEELLKKAKADAQKAEAFIQTVSSERDDRFSVLQQENDAIKTTVMGLLRSTQESYDADKFLLKKEMRKRDDRIRALQDDLWKSNGLLKRLQAQGVGANDAKLTASVSQYLSHKPLMEDNEDAKESKEDDHHTYQHQKNNKRGSTYEAAENILEGKKKDCDELKQLQNLLGAK